MPRFGVVGSRSLLPIVDQDSARGFHKKAFCEICSGEFSWGSRLIGRPPTAPTKAQRRYLIERIHAGLKHYGAEAADLYDCRSQLMLDPFFDSDFKPLGAERFVVDLVDSLIEVVPYPRRFDTIAIPEGGLQYNGAVKTEDLGITYLLQARGRLTGRLQIRPSANRLKARDDRKRLETAVTEALREGKETSRQRFRDIFLLLHFCEKRFAWLHGDKPDVWRATCMYDDALLNILTSDYGVVNELILPYNLISADTDWRLFQVCEEIIDRASKVRKSEFQTLTEKLEGYVGFARISLALEMLPPMVAILRSRERILIDHIRKSEALVAKQKAELRVLRLEKRRLRIAE